MLAPRRTERRQRSTARQWLVLLVAAVLGAALLASAPSALARPGDPPPSSTPSSTPPTTDPTDPTETSPPSEPTSTSSPTSAPPTTTRPSTSTSPSPPPADPPPADPPPDNGPTVDPPPFSEVIEGAAPGQETLAAEAMALSMLVVQTSERLDQLGLEAEAAADTYRQAEGELDVAQAQAQEASVQSAAADRELATARQSVGQFARNSYISGSTLATDLLILDADSPGQLVERAGLLESVATSRLQVLAEVEAAQARSDNADRIAEDALSTKVDAEAAAQEALDESTALLEQQEVELSDLLEQKAELDAQFYAALVDLLGPEGAAAAFLAYEQDQLDQDALEAAARQAAYGGGPVLSGAWALPLRGTLTSCYCQRWGTMHWGIDIAAPMYTPMYSAGDGTVIQAGPATGFGQAVYIQHTNGDVTVYGHMEVIEVVAGQRVAGGQEIALVGSQGFSTGPHLHFEVHVGDINGTRVDPVIWLANRGVYV